MFIIAIGYWLVYALFGRIYSEGRRRFKDLLRRCVGLSFVLVPLFTFPVTENTKAPGTLEVFLDQILCCFVTSKASKGIKRLKCFVMLCLFCCLQYATLTACTRSSAPGTRGTTAQASVSAAHVTDKFSNDPKYSTASNGSL